MANVVANVALGRGAHYASQVGVGNAALVVVLLQAAEADDALRDHDDLAALLAVTGNTEATFTNYARIIRTTGTVTVDDVANTVAADTADFTWTDAGGATNNTLVKLLICYDPDTTVGTDADIIPLTLHDYAETTTGSTITATVDAAGYYGAS
jgi:hypothetical protein